MRAQRIDRHPDTTGNGASGYFEDLRQVLAWVPTPAEIERGAAEIRQHWTPRERRKRAWQSFRVGLAPIAISVSRKVLPFDESW